VQWFAGFTDRLETADVTSVDELDRLLDALTTRAVGTLLARILRVLRARARMGRQTDTSIAKEPW
jgi:hypothetical protein